MIIVYGTPLDNMIHKRKKAMEYDRPVEINANMDTSNDLHVRYNLMHQPWPA